MVIVQFTGYIHPMIPSVNSHNLPMIAGHDRPLEGPYLERIMITQYISIAQSKVTILCTVDPWEDGFLGRVYARASLTAHAIVDLFSFSSGRGLMLTLDTVVLPSGETKNIDRYNPALEALCTTVVPGDGGASFYRSLEVLFSNPDIALTLRDLVNANTFPNAIPIDCARAIEGLRQILYPDVDKRGAGWAILQEALNVSRTYLELITDKSVGYRHGEKLFFPQETSDEVLRRSWTIMNRFIVLRTRGIEKLPYDEFPLLD